MIEIKPYLIEKSEHLVDLIEGLEEAVAKNDENKSTDYMAQLNKMGEELVELMPNLKEDDWAYTNFMMGSLCSSLRMWSEAEDAFQKSLTIWPDHVGILNELFVAQYEMSKFQQAIETMEKSIEHGGETPDVLHNLAAATWQVGKKGQAKIMVINALAKYPNTESLIELLQDMEN